jgi:hypothetical protein
MPDERTINRNYPLPHPDNMLEEDVNRIKDSFEQIDLDVNDLLITTAQSSEDLQAGSYWYGISTGTSSAYEVILNPVPTVLNAGMFIRIKAHIQNTGLATISVNFLGIKSIKRIDGTDLKQGDIPQNALVTLIYDGVNFQLTNAIADPETEEINASNIMRAFDEIQENHGGALLMEVGWSDSFGNPNEQGADEANSIGGVHDGVNTLYKGSDPGVGSNSDKNYDTESDYIQQEWTNANQVTSQASAANGSTAATLSSGSWPTNCAKGRITFDAGVTWYDIVSRDSDTGLTLGINFADTTSLYDYIIRSTEFDSGEVKLNSILSGYGPNIASQATASASSIKHSVVGANYANDGNNTTRWEANTQNSGWLKLDFGIGITKTLIQYKLYMQDQFGHIPKTWTLEGSNDDGTWVILDTQSDVTNWVIPETKTFNFNNTIGYRYYRINISLANTSTATPQIYELQVMEKDISNVFSQYVSICDTETQKVYSSAWSDINSSSLIETLNSQNAYYWLAFDPTGNFGDGTEIKTFNPTGTVWRKIAQNNAGTWEYNNNITDTASENWVTSTTNDMLHAVSQAILIQTANQMTGANLASITDAQWEEVGGWLFSTNSIVRGLTLHSNNSSQNPSVSQYRLNYDSERGAIDLRSKPYDPGFVPSESYIWSRIEHSDSDGPGTFYITRNGGAEWIPVSLTQQGLPLAGDIRIYRGTVDMSGQTSGQDLRCRYETAHGKDQFIHSWGLQVKS